MISVKQALNVSKYASSTAVEGELGRFPVNNTVKGLMIKYWLRLNAGASNSLLNEAYKECYEKEHEWLQNIQYLLYENGFGNVWNSPNSVNADLFHKYFRQRLNDIHVQNWNSKLSLSNRFDTLRMLHKNYSIENYIKVINDAKKREIFTRLRIDVNILSTCKGQGNLQQELCPLCNAEPESVTHFLFSCNKYSDIRTIFIDKILTHHVGFDSLNEREKLSFILNLECPQELIGICCFFISEMYDSRISDNQAAR